MSLSSSTLQILFSQFQTRYPMGSLISEFLTVHDGMYAVRAIAQIGTTVLATGMAAHPDLEAAEDRAKVRALEALALLTPVLPLTSERPPLSPSPLANWSPTPLDSTSQQSLAQQPPEPRATVDLTANVSLETPIPIASSPPSEIASLGVSPLPLWTPPTPQVPLTGLEPDSLAATGSTVPGPMATGSVVADFYSHINADTDDLPAIPDGRASDEVTLTREEGQGEPVAVAPSLPVAPSPSVASSLPVASVSGKPRRKAATSAEQTVSSSVSVDLSDVIAQTDVELARLDWNKIQGREHLKLTYGKRSRQELNETELYDFLHYLQAQ